MFARVTRTKGADPAKIDEANEFARVNVLPRARQLSGWKGVISLGNRQTGDALLITLWDSEAAMHASAEAAKGLRSEGEAKTGETEMEVQGYEVLMFQPE